MRLTFHGGAGTVTGSRHLLECGSQRLLVDCGLFQGKKELRERNWGHPGFDPRSVDALVLTHAHIDHSGYIPRLVRDGFRGPIYATPATADLADVMLRDSAKIQEEDAAYANKKGFSKHHPALPLYTVPDAERALDQFEVVDYADWMEVGPGLAFRFRHAGHIIGSGQVDVDAREGDQSARLLFSGDVGRYDAPLVPDPQAPEPCDYLIIESTYGDREHAAVSVEEQLREHLATIVRTQGTLLVPSFAVGRAQQLIYLLRKVMEADARLDLPIHLDSPMAINATKIYRRYPEEHGLETVELRSGSSRIYGRHVFLHRTQEESMRLNSLGGPRVIISSSGMMTGGRVLHHLKRLLPQQHNLILLAGYQAPGTRGWRLQRGEPTLRIHGQDVAVHAPFTTISGTSAHADADQLVRWVRDLPPPLATFVVHGDDGASAALAKRFTAELGFHCETPELGAAHELEPVRDRS